ncbi:MAG TPA: hypothetical protein PKD64_10295 [Pirellulaceae bacterium]|nr:hypothetical protein [Pirellulaceae bacterium]HMO92571.1 hypothetical protein [Pirellulaceae bacterium]HMP70631.1 hypothetical protein [Pirellulaceae bacterium]
MPVEKQYWIVKKVGHAVTGPFTNDQIIKAIQRNSWKPEWQVSEDGRSYYPFHHFFKQLMAEVQNVKRGEEPVVFEPIIDDQQPTTARRARFAGEPTPVPKPSPPRVSNTVQERPAAETTPQRVHVSPASSGVGRVDRDSDAPTPPPPPTMSYDSSFDPIVSASSQGGHEEFTTIGKLSVSRQGNDLVHFAVKMTRKLMNVILILWWAGCLLFALFGVWTAFAFLTTQSPREISEEPQYTALTIIVAALIAVFYVVVSVLLAGLGLVFTGTIGVLFEIESNTRRLRVDD